MTLELIKHNALSIVEASYLYDEMERKGSTKDAEEMRVYMLSLLSKIDSLIKEERNKLQDE